MSLLKKIFILIIFFATTFFANESLIYSQNNLLNSLYWTSFKGNFLTPSAGAIESLVSRTLLASYKLIGNKNLGHQFILSKENYEFNKLATSVKLRDQSYIDFIFNYDGRSFDGVRIGRSINYPSQLYHANISGEIISQTSMPNIITDDQYHQIVFEINNNLINLIIDGVSKYKINLKIQRKPIGLFTSLANYEVHEIRLFDFENHETILPFSNTQLRLNFYFKNMILIATLILLLTFIMRFYYKDQLWGIVTRINLFLFFISIIYLLFDFTYYSKIPQNWDYANFISTGQIKSNFNLESYRNKFFNLWYSVLGGEVTSESKLNHNKVFFNLRHRIRVCNVKSCYFESVTPKNHLKNSDQKNILFLGGSFSDSAGVLSEKNSFFEHLSNNLINNYKTYKIQITNYSTSGILFDSNIELLKNVVNNYRADYVILAIYIEEIDYPKLANFIKYLNSKNIKLLRLVPIFDTESLNNFMLLPSELKNEIKHYKLVDRPDFFHKNSYTESELKQIVYSYNLNELAVTPKFYHQGIMWWDEGHMTEFGQKKIAEFVVNLFKFYYPIL